MTLQAISAETIAKKVMNKEALFIFDVRNSDAFTDWKIEGAKVTHRNIPYFDLLDGIDDIIHELPKDEPIIVVCAKEHSSIMIGEMLAEKGFDTYYLAGGMQAWSEQLIPVKIGNLSNDGEIYQFVRIGKGCLSYMVISNGETAIIDATRFTDTFIRFAKDKQAKITHVLDTHLHADHISGGRKIAKKTNASYWLPPKDASEVVFDYEPLIDGDRITVGHTTVDLHALYSPGHTIGSTSFIIDASYLLTGDILFIDSIGRPDLAGLAEDWVGDLYESLYDRYRKLADDLIVLPAHFMGMDEMNTDGSIAKKLGTLFKENHGLNIDDEADFRQLVTENLPPQPNAYHEIRQINLGKLNPDQKTQQEMEIGPNRCAVR